MQRNLSKVRRFCEKHAAAFSEASVRWLIFHREKNGLADSGAIVRNGRAILIDEDKFFAWLESRQGRAA